MNHSWFEVDKEGLKELYSDRTPFDLVAEIVQNAWDEKIHECNVVLHQKGGKAVLKVIDDNPEGFKNIRDAYTLFGNTHKRPDPTKRGRFNIGEKIVLAQAISGSISTTKGVVQFGELGRSEFLGENYGRKKGSVFEAIFPWTRQQVRETIEKLENLLVPKRIVFTVNGKVIKSRRPDWVQEAVLPTVVFDNGEKFVPQRKTRIEIYSTEKEKGQLYEMGLPVCEIDCPYKVNVSQRVPVTIDRNTVSPRYLRSIYAYVLNACYQTLGEEKASEQWVRDAVGHRVCSKEARKWVLKKRFGSKVLIANPLDQGSIQEALDKGYKVIYGRELGTEERQAFKEAGLSSTSDVFKCTIDKDEVIPVEKWTREQKAMAVFAKKLAKELINKDIKVNITRTSGFLAAYNNALNVLSFSHTRLGRKFFEGGITARSIGIILHELAHTANTKNGYHVDMSYVSTLDQLAGACVFLAIEKPDIFKWEKYLDGVS